MPLTDAEQRELQARFRVARRVSSIQRYVSHNASTTFSGLYLDQAHRGLVYIGFTRGAANRLRALRKVFSYTNRLRVFTAAYTLAQLQRLHRRIDQDWSLLRRDGIDMRTSTVDVPTNRVLVGVSDRVPSGRAALRRRYGNMVRVIRAHVQRTSCSQCSGTTRTTVQSPPLDGGLEINDLSAQCTSGFVTQAANGAFFLMTAGHCGHNGSGWAQGFFNSDIGLQGPDVGTMDRNSYYNGSSADAAVIDMPSYEADNAVYRDGGYQQINSIKPFGSDLLGSAVCHSGITSEYECGTITSTDSTEQYGSGPVLYHMREAYMYNAPGDSGGPVFMGAGAVGIVSGETCSSSPCTSNNVTGTIYSYIVNADNANGVRVYTP